MIKVTGRAYLSVPFEVELDMTEEKFDKLSRRKQDQLLDESIDWKEACRSAETDDYEIDDVKEETK